MTSVHQLTFYDAKNKPKNNKDVFNFKSLRLVKMQVPYS